MVTPKVLHTVPKQAYTDGDLKDGEKCKKNFAFIKLHICGNYGLENILII